MPAGDGPWWRRLLWWRPPCLLRRVVVHLSDDPTASLQGVLWAARGPWLTLRSVELVTPDTQPAAIVGEEVIIHRGNVSFIVVQGKG